MARGMWEDFDSKYGFGDGGQLEERDFRARAVLVNLLNEKLKALMTPVQAVEYDRPGCRNSCLVIFEDNSGNTVNTNDLPDELTELFENFVEEAYDSLVE